MILAVLPTNLQNFVMLTLTTPWLYTRTPSAAVKARADWVVTSSIALEIVESLDAEGKPIIWGPDRHLGSYIANQTGADMLLWQGECITAMNSQLMH